MAPVLRYFEDRSRVGMMRRDGGTLMVSKKRERGGVGIQSHNGNNMAAFSQTLGRQTTMRLLFIVYPSNEGGGAQQQFSSGATSSDSRSRRPASRGGIVFEPGTKKWRQKNKHFFQQERIMTLH